MHALVSAVVIGTGTLLEAIRSRLLMVGVLFAIVLVILSVSAASVSIGEQSRLIIDVGLTATSALGSLMAIALAIVSFASEIQKRTAYPLLARPIPRWAFVLGKYLGTLMAMELIVMMMGIATAIIVWLYGGDIPAAFWATLFLTGIEMTLVVSIAICFSTMTVPVLAAAYSIALLVVGNLVADIQMLGDKLINQGQLSGIILEWLFYIIPDLGKLSLRTQAANALPVEGSYIFLGGLYGVLYALVALFLGMWIFSHRKAI